MGKIRVKTLGDEEKEKKEKKETERRAEIKKLQDDAKAAKEAKVESPAVEAEIAPAETKKATKAVKKAPAKKKEHSDTYLKVAEKVDKDKVYALTDALRLLEELKRAKFDETVELHFNTMDKGVSGNVTLPHGTGKEVKVEILNMSEDPKHVEDVVKKIEAGSVEFDVLIATPDTMPKLAKVARFLGPKGLMPNPKNGTVTPKPNEAAKKFLGGQVNFKTEAKFPLLHMAIGKISFGEKKLADNAKAAIAAVQLKNIKNATLKSTMSPGIKIDAANL